MNFTILGISVILLLIPFIIVIFCSYKDEDIKPAEYHKEYEYTEEQYKEAQHRAFHTGYWAGMAVD